MLNKRGTIGFFLGAALAMGGLAACDTGSANGTPPDEPDKLDLLCTTEAALSGTFAVDGEAPVGTWTVIATLAGQGDCTAAVPVQPQYVYTVTQLLDQDGQPNGFDVVLQNDPSPDTSFMKVTSGGGGYNGSFEHWTPAGTELVLVKPYEENGVISGTATYELYSKNQL